MTKKHEDFSELSYSLHKKHLSRYLKDKKLYKFSKSWLRNDTVDYWRHKRMYEQLGPLIKLYPDAKWLTVGDGRYGRDAEYIQSQGVKNVLATDIVDTLLKQAKKIGFIKQYKKENAEKLSFKNESFDYVFCKESFHHFPRPMIALYEMLRVAKRAVILIEPRDVSFRDSPLLRLKKIFNNKKDVSAYGNKFESSGNFVYSLSYRDVEKVALGINLPMIASLGIDDHYIKGTEKESLKGKTLLKSKIEKRLRVLRVLSKLKLRKTNLICVIIFKNKPFKSMIKSLEKHGYEINMLPRNPYIS